MKPSYEKFEALMNAKGVRPADVKTAIGLKSQSVFTDWKNKKSYPKTDKLIAIAMYFGVAVEDLMEAK